MIFPYLLAMYGHKLRVLLLDFTHNLIQPLRDEESGFLKNGAHVGRDEVDLRRHLGRRQLQAVGRLTPEGAAPAPTAETAEPFFAGFRR